MEDKERIKNKDQKLTKKAMKPVAKFNSKIERLYGNMNTKDGFKTSYNTYDKRTPSEGLVLVKRLDQAAKESNANYKYK